MSPREELILAMAKADQMRRPGPIPWDRRTPDSRTAIMRRMELRLRDIEAHAGGCVVVPCQTITAEMHRAMYGQNDTFDQMWPRGCAASPYARPAIARTRRR